MANNEDAFLPALRLIHTGYLLHDPPFAAPPAEGGPDTGQSRFSTARAEGELCLQVLKWTCHGGTVMLKESFVRMGDEVARLGFFLLYAF
jgi:hypothetical protein